MPFPIPDHHRFVVIDSPEKIFILAKGLADISALCVLLSCHDHPLKGRRRVVVEENAKKLIDPETDAKVLAWLSGEAKAPEFVYPCGGVKDLLIAFGLVAGGH